MKILERLRFYMPAPTPTKICTRCRENKPLEEFPRSPSKYAIHGRGWACKKCRAITAAAWRNKNLPLFYGISTEQYEQLLETRGTRCPICGDKNESPNIDHCHKTGKVRGLLCGRCNTALGMLRDNPRACLRAAIYLQSAGEPGFPCNLNTLNSLVDEAFAGLKPRRRSALRFRFAGL
jgi:hypothetical protein